MSTWLEQLIWQKNGAARMSEKALDLLRYRDSQLAEKDARVGQLETELGKTVGLLHFRDAQLAQQEEQVAELQNRLELANHKLLAAEAFVKHASQMHAAQTTTLKDSARKVAEEQADKISSLKASFFLGLPHAC